MDLFPRSLSVLLADLEPAVVGLAVVLPVALFVVAAVTGRRAVSVVAAVQLGLIALVVGPLVERAALGKAKPVDMGYLAERYGPDREGRETKLRVLAYKLRAGKDGGNIGLLVDVPDDGRDPEWLLLPHSEELEKRLRELEAQQRAMKREGRDAPGIRVRIRKRTDREREGDREGDRGGRYERNWEDRFDMRYELDWPEVPPPKSPEEGGIDVE